MALRDAFVNIAKNAAASAATGFVSAVADGLRSGASPANAKSGALQSSFNAKAKPILMYPAGLGTDGRNLNYIMFTPMSVDHTKLKKNLGQGPNVTALLNRDEEQGGGLGGLEAAQAKDVTLRVQSASVGETSSIYLNSREFTTTKIQRTIALYMPPQLNVSYGMEYAESEISGFSSVLYGLFKTYQSTGELDIKGLQSGEAAEVLKQQAAKIVNGIPGLSGAKDLIAMERGKIATPKMELMFRGVSRREFSFAFTFLPEDKMDGQTVQEIIREFKIGMHPEFDANAGSRSQKIPDIFEIAYHHTMGPNLNLHRIGKCFLKKMDVTYGGDQFQTFKSDGDDYNGAPVKTTISLTFGEITLIDKNMVSPSVGGY